MNRNEEIEQETRKLLTRRWFFKECRVGIGSLALASLGRFMMNNPTIRILPWTMILACLICSIASGQEKRSGCHDHQSLWRDAQGKPVRLGSKELKNRRISCETPKLPGQWCGKGQIMFQVVINAEGKIECAEALTEFHPWIKPHALDALKKWTFKPFKVGGKPIAALGIVVVDVSWDSAHGQCRSK